MNPYKFISGLLLFISIGSAFGQPININWPEVKDSINLVDTHSRPVEFQNKQVFSFPGIGVGVRNDFTSARLNKLILVNDSILSGCITPENFPINLSPWYSFKIWAETEKDIYFRLTYKEGQHRYIPRLSKDGQNWVQIDMENLYTGMEDTTGFFKLSISKDTLWVSSQEIMSSASAYQWIESLTQKPYIESQVIGESTQGRPLKAISISESDGSNLLVILSRQHPPELAGYNEMISFVETIAGESKQAKKFRKKFKVIVVPMMNPDGVDNGHWRHSAGGIDLNRDWRHFNQPETFAFRKFILEEIEKNNAQVRFGIDFHSTYIDLFYIQPEEALPEGKGISMTYINTINKKIPDNPFEPVPSGIEGQNSSNWFLHELGVEAITYEVGDNTDREVIRKRGEIAALALMKILRKKYK